MVVKNPLAFVSNIYFWMGMAFIFLLLFVICFIFIVYLAKKTHAMVEFKAIRRGIPICMFFDESRYVEWKPLKSDAGIVTDKNYGSFIINERATYVDKRTKAIIVPFDSQFGSSMNMHSAVLADNLQFLVKDDEELKKLRFAFVNDLIDENQEINVLKTSIHFGAMKAMMTAMIPHNIEGKISKVINSRLKGMGQVNIIQIILIFAAILGAVVLSVIIIRLTLGK